jgi:hypothetical protein
MPFNSSVTLNAGRALFNSSFNVDCCVSSLIFESVIELPLLIGGPEIGHHDFMGQRRNVAGGTIARDNSWLLLEFSPPTWVSASLEDGN